MQSSGWKLVRAAVVKVGNDPSPRIGHFQLGPVEVFRTRSVSRDGQAIGAVYVAYVPVEINPDSDIAELLSGQARHDAEEALEALARISAVDSRSTHELSSVSPFIGLASDSADDLAGLEGRAVAIRSMVSRHKVDSPTNILETVDLNVFADRLEGVALLAEAINSQSPLGRYSQLLRLFESAFRLGPSGLTEPLANFLASSKHCFEAEEVRAWTYARSFAIHADRRDEIYLDSDVRPFELRMLEAGYDVLLNKAKWRSKSSDRREIWAALGGSIGVNAGMYLTRGQAATIGIQVLDGFLAYPMVTAGPFTTVLPRAAWLMGDDDDASKLEILGDWKAETFSEEDQEVAQN